MSSVDSFFEGEPGEYFPSLSPESLDLLDKHPELAAYVMALEARTLELSDELEASYEENSVLTDEFSKADSEKRMAISERDFFYEVATNLSGKAKSRKQRADELEKEVFVDEKTKVLNYKGLRNEYEALASRLQRRVGDHNAILFIDFDKFHDINDQITHAGADRLLHMLAQRMDARLREGDVFGRYGGDEFIALLPSTSILDAEQVAEDLRSLVEEVSVIDGMLIRPTLSIGVGSLNPALPLDEAVRGANKAMFEAKRGGRNQVITFSEELNA